MSWTDPANPYLSGRVGVRQCLGRHVHWDNFRASEAAPDQVVAWDDFYPYGQVMAERSANAALPEARFKYTGKERDGESGYDYFGARYYDARIARWLSVDPAQEWRSGISPYNYVQSNPILRNDPTGTLDEVVGADEESRSAILKSLRPADAKHVVFDSNGKIEAAELAKADSKDDNLIALKELVESKTVYEVHATESFAYHNAAGEEKSISFGKANGTTGFTGFTLAPDLSDYSSTNGNVQVYLNVNNTPLGKSMAVSHELFSHALFYDRGLPWTHRYSGGADQNKMLVRQILHLRELTIRNYNKW